MNKRNVKIKLNKKNVIILIVCIIILFIIIGIIVNKNKTIDVSDAKHYITIEENVVFYKKMQTENVEIYRTLEIGTKVYVLEECEENRSELE